MNVRARKRDQLTIVETVIGIRDQILVLAPVVPAERHSAKRT